VNVETGPGKSLLILGCGGHGRVLADAAQEAGYQTIAFADPKWPALQESGPWKVVSDGGNLTALKADYRSAVSGVGADSALRLKETLALLDAGFDVPVITHPGSHVSRHARIGAGTVIFAGAVVNIGALIGRAVIVNTGATIDHDCQIADGAHIAPGARLAGAVTVGALSWIGIGASVRQGAVIGERVIVGAGAAVVSNLPDGVTAVGVPARTVHRLAESYGEPHTV
jgi:sugar O-acyltransferase (sialic acid O-acetyltransferase NeuD family)